MMINYGNNMPANQNGDINFTTDILRDDSLCEFIVCYDVVMTDSAKYADIILPDLTPQETWTLSTQGENNDTQGIWFGQPTASAKFERREVYEVCADLADRLGVKDAYTDGGRPRGLVPRAVRGVPRRESRRSHLGRAWQLAFTRRTSRWTTPDPFIEDPAANPLETATGKIQIYSPSWPSTPLRGSCRRATSSAPSRFTCPARRPRLNTEEYPLQFTGYHTKAHTHSSYANNQIIRMPIATTSGSIRWMRPSAYETGGMVACSDHGEILIEAKVTDRIMPGVVPFRRACGTMPTWTATRVDKGGSHADEPPLHSVAKARPAHHHRPDRQA
ncbi:MAG: molybdopterin-dependent oxidoreductase [Coriobacteriaceae bacterium]